MRGTIRKIFNKTAHVSTHTHIGRKANQEDALFVSARKNDKQLIFVADGVGGHGHGDFASMLTVNMFKTAFENNSIYDISRFLNKSTLNIAEAVLAQGISNPAFKNCGTTISGFLIDRDDFYTLNVGDSRVYLFDNEICKQLTKDHSEVQRLLDLGAITEDEAFTHHRRNIMTSAIGQSIDMIKIDINGPYQINAGEMLLAFTDGVHDALRNNEIISILRQHKNSHDLAKIIVEAAYNAGGKDNITACVYRH